jgi:hypothetical protein
VNGWLKSWGILGGGLSREQALEVANCISEVNKWQGLDYLDHIAALDVLGGAIIIEEE